MSKTICINCKQVVEYSQWHTVTDEEYEILEAREYDEVQEGDDAYKVIERYINYNDVLCTEEEFTSISIELAKPEKKSTK